MGNPLAFAHIIIAVVGGLASSETLFHKPGGFHSDDAHNAFFRGIDRDQDGLISRSEYLNSISPNEAVFDYVVHRRNLLPVPSNETELLGSNRDDLSYSDFMWFYREAVLFETRGMIPPVQPTKLYSFPRWPGMKAVGVPEEFKTMAPHKFWTDYVIPHRALVVRGALEGSDALVNWGEPEYLISRFGDLEAKVEHRLEARGDSLMKKVSKSGRARVRDIVEKNVDGYVVSVVPQPMAWEVNVPNCVLCGSRSRNYLDLSPSYSFMTEIEETSLWISRGRTRSQFHYDKENTFNCLVTGKPKEWVILDTRKYGEKVPWVRGGGYNMTDDRETLYTDWVGVDVDRVDLNLHSYLLEAEFEVVTQYPGDCIFIPYSMLHYAGHLVEDDTLQVAVSFMWLPETTYNERNCPKEFSKSGIPLAVFDTVWYYSGFGAVPQGHHNPRHLAEAITPRSNNNTVLFNRLAVVRFLSPGTRSTDPGFEYVLSCLKLVEECVKHGVDVPLDLWLELSTAVDMNGLGCNRNQTYIPRPLEELNRMFAFLQHLGG
jgi:hypothetical protein